MKIFHLSDLHLGKKVNEYSMIEDQKYILSQILEHIDKEKPDCLLIAGDIYDRQNPPEEAVDLLNNFYEQLAQRKLPVFAISGNHDSAGRVAFGHSLIDLSGIHISPKYNGKIKPFSMEDEYGKLNIYMMPFVKPANVRVFFPDKEINTYTDALRVAVEEININTAERNILISHQFVTGAMRSDSEEVSVGGLDNVDASVFNNFDYVALGHIHKPQNIGGENKVRYCGTPLKYSFSEANDKKSITVVELKEKESMQVTTIPLDPMHDMVEIKGTFNEITSRDFYEGAEFKNDYLHITLTDEDIVSEAMARLHVIYPKIMKLDYDNKRTRNMAKISTDNNVQEKGPLEIFSQFYEVQNNQPMTEEQSKLINKLIEEIWGENK